jgi:hypothetical protein
MRLNAAADHFAAALAAARQLEVADEQEETAAAVDPPDARNC